MSIGQSFTAGLRRVARFPSLIFGVYSASVLLALPLALALRSILQESIGASLVHENLRQGFDMTWYGEFSSNSTGLGETFGPTVVGLLPLLSNLERLLDGELLNTDWSILLAGGLFLLVWAFLGGGILDRYARPEEAHSRSRFFSQSGDYFFPFVQLLIFSVLLYWGLFRGLVNPLHEWLEEATRDVTRESTILYYTFSVYALVGLLLVLISMILDYAKIFLVVERRRNSLLALLRGLRFVVSHPARTLGLYFLLAGVGLLLMIAYGLVAPGPGQARWLTVLLAFLLGQAYLLTRVGLKLWFLASQSALFQSARESA